MGRRLSRLDIVPESPIRSRLAAGSVLIANQLKMVSPPMGGKTIFQHYSLYRRRILIILFISIITSLVHLFHNGSEIFAPFVLAGLLDRDEVNTDNWAVISRVSTPDQEGDGSLDIQEEKIHKERQKAGGELVESFHGSESATSADRKTLNDIVTLAQEGRVDVFAAYKIDRITRARPMESMEFFQDLYEADVTIYIHKEGYLDLNSLSDFQLVTDRIKEARRQWETIIESANESYIQGLNQGKYRFNKPHFGYTTDDERYLQLTSLGEKAIPRIFEVYIDLENRSKTVDTINNEFDLSGDDKLSYYQVRRVLESRICIGELFYQGKLINTKPELAVVSRKQFRQAQKIAEERRNTSTQDEIWPDWMSEFAKRYNLNILISRIGNLQARCGKCDGELIRYGTYEIKETTVPKIKCKDCGYQGPLITRGEFDQLHPTAPMKCPECIAVDGADAGFEYKEIEHGRWDYEVTCSLCGCSFGTNSGPEVDEEAKDQSRLEYTREDQDVKRLLKDILEEKKQETTTGSSAPPEQADSSESENSDCRSLFSFS